MARWRFEDPILLTSYVFDVNPNEAARASYRKGMDYQNTAAPGGKVLMFEGRDEAQQLEFKGTILEQDQYEAMVEWFDKRYQLTVVDDIGRVSTIYITGFEATRQRALHHPWKHTYTVRYTLIDWPA